MGIPVWAVALILIIGTVAGAGIWILTVNVPVEYYEPVQVYYSSEDMVPGDTPQPGEWYGPLQLRDSRTTDATELTYGTLHDYIRAVNPAEGKDPVNLTVDIQAYNTTGDPTNDIGFVVIPELAGPRDITWTYSGADRSSATFNGTTYPVQWGNTQINETLAANSEYTYTVIDVVADGVNVDTYEIVWELSDTTV
ncbi:MAG: hypothetical protein R6U61_03340 [Thermoplasmata archaeon]